MDRPSFTIELAADARFAQDLAAGGVFVPARGFKVLDEIDLVVRGEGGELCLHARVVYVDPATGCGLELVGFGPEIKARLATIAHSPAEVAAVRATAQRRKRVLTGRSRRTSIEPIALDDDATPSDDADDDDAEAVATGNDRLRGLSLADQLKVARGPSAAERMALERMYGKNVWEALLHNPSLSVPEVARLARLGTLPRVLLELIVNNTTWLQVPEVRRALLGNPRLGTDQITRVLRLMPRHELKIASTVPAYPHSVRSLAKKLLKSDA